MTKAALIGSCLGVFLAVASTSSAQPGCSDPCRPSAAFRVTWGGTVSFDASMAISGSSLSDFHNAMWAWEGLISDSNGWVNVTDASGDVHVTVDNSMISSGLWAEGDRENRTLRINPEIFGYTGAFYNLMLHEIGHFVGFNDVLRSPGDVPCGVSSSAMIAGVTGTELSGAPGLTSADACSTYHSYGIRDESPIVIRLDRGEISLTGPEVSFDLNCTGTPQLLGWTVADVNEGFLVFDRDGDHQITDGREMFGNFTPLSWSFDGPTATNGFEALGWFDQPTHGGNADGMISDIDAVFNRLRLWIDADHNGISDGDELKTLSSVGVREIALTYRESRKRDAYGNEFRYLSLVRALNNVGHEVIRRAYDVFLTHQQ